MLSIVRCSHVVPREVFAKAADIVRAEHQADDLVVVLPYSQMTPRLLLPGIALIELQTIEPDRFRDYKRVWLFDVGAVGRSQKDVDAVQSAGAVTELLNAHGLRLVRIEVENPRDPPQRGAWRR